MAGGNFWTPEEMRFVAELYARDLTPEKVRDIHASRFPGRSIRSIQKIRSERLTEMIADIQAGNVSHVEVFLGLRDEEDAPILEPDWQGKSVDPAELWVRAEERAEEYVDYQKKRHKATVTFPGDKPIALSFISDQHISEGMATYMERMRKDAELIAETDGLYAVLGGDGVDQAIKHRTHMVSSGSKPAHEWLMYDHYLGMFDGSIAAMCSGNHDDFAKDITDHDNVSALAKKNRIFYAPDYVVLNVKLGGQAYVVGIRHQYRYGSSFNLTHTVKRWWEMDDIDFDIGVVCHNHEYAIECFRKHGLERWAFRPGSYQMVSGYSRRYGYKASVPTCPTVVLFPNRREMLGIKDVRQAASYLRWLREGWPHTDFEAAA